LAEVKKAAGSPKAQLFANTEVDVDGDTIVVEFAQDQSLARELADKQEVREALKHGITSVMGAAAPFRFQVGRGPVQPPAPEPPASEPVAVAPAAVPASAPVQEGTPSEGSGGDAVEAMLLNDFGAEVVEE
jgi:hypothetical protein